MTCNVFYARPRLQSRLVHLLLLLVIIRRVVEALRTSRRILWTVPLRLGLPPHDRARRSVPREMPLKDFTDKVGFLGGRGIVRESFARFGKVGVGDGSLRVRFEAVDPAVADTVGELLLLSPEDRVGQVCSSIGRDVECLSQDVLQTTG